MIVLADLDSTIADTRHRRHLCPTVDTSKTWTDYALGCADDTPITGPIALLRTFAAFGDDIHIVSHRDPAARDLTAAWLDRHHIPYSALNLGVHKVTYVMHLRAAGHDIRLAIDDDPDIAAAYESVDLPVVCVNPRYSHRP